MSDRLYPRFGIAAVAAVLIKDGRVLLVERGYPPAAGKWSFPGGVIEAGERLGEAAKRELFEETGLEAEPLGILWVLNNIVRDSSGRVKYHYLIIDILFDPNSVRGEPRPGGDAKNIAWVPIEEALSLPNVSRTVKKLLNRVLKHGLSYIPLEDVDNESVEKA